MSKKCNNKSTYVLLWQSSVNLVQKHGLQYDVTKTASLITMHADFSRVKSMFRARLENNNMYIGINTLHPEHIQLNYRYKQQNMVVNVKSCIPIHKGQ